MNEKRSSFLTQNLQLWQFVAIIVGSVWLLLGFINSRLDRLDDKLQSKLEKIENKFEVFNKSFSELDKKQAITESIVHGCCPVNKLEKQFCNGRSGYEKSPS